MLFLDTCVCVDLLSAPLLELEIHRIGQKARDCAVSSIVMAELQHGVSKSNRPEHHQANLDSLSGFLKTIPFDDNAARHYGDIRAELEKTRTSIGPFDILIAAHARSLGATLMTDNTKEFRRVKGLKLLSWK